MEKCFLKRKKWKKKSKNEKKKKEKLNITGFQQEGRKKWYWDVIDTKNYQDSSGGQWKDIKDLLNASALDQITQKERAFTSTSFFRGCRVSRLLHRIDGPVGQCSWVLLLATYFRIRPIVHTSWSFLEFAASIRENVVTHLRKHLVIKITNWSKFMMKTKHLRNFYSVICQVNT